MTTMCSANKKHGFTLTEVLVVVLVISVLASIAYPMYTKSVTKSRAVEAINLLEMVRNKQLQRFAKDGHYSASFEGIGQITSDKGKEVADGNSLKVKNYTLTLDNDNACASATYEKGSVSFTFSTGYNRSGLGCTGDICSSFSNVVGAAGDVCKTEVVPSTPEPPTGPVTPDPLECSEPQPSSTEDCDNCGVKTRVVTCDSATGQWQVSAFGQCIGNKTDTSPCPAGFTGQKIRNCTNNVWGEWDSSACTNCSTGGCCPGAMPATNEYCSNCGIKIRTVSCNTTTFQWDIGAWGSCKTVSGCSSPCFGSDCSSANTTSCVRTEAIACTGGHKSRRCVDNVWQDWDLTNCVSCTEATKPATMEYCSNCGLKNRTVTCNAQTNQWEAGAWSSCVTASCSSPCVGESCNAQPENSCVKTESIACTGGHKSRQCVNNVWQNWDMTNCVGCSEASKPAAMEYCDNCGAKTRTVTCNAQTNQWEAGAWSSCSTTAGCSSPCSGTGCIGQNTNTCVRIETTACAVRGYKTKQCINNVWQTQWTPAPDCCEHE